MCRNVLGSAEKLARLVIWFNVHMLLVPIILGEFAAVLAQSSGRASGSSPASTSTLSASFAVTVPSNDNNPFIEHTTLPEGTLFIACGSIFGGLVLTLLLWRVASMIAAAKAAKNSDKQFAAIEQSYGGPFNDPVTSGDQFAAFAPPKKHAPTMFFSPTVMAMNANSEGPMVPQSSSYLPAGYYASSTAPSQRVSMVREGNVTRPPSTMWSQGDSSSPDPSYNNTTTSLPMTERMSMAGSAPRPKQRPPTQYLDELLRH